MKKMMKTTCALAVLAASCNVMAESVDMRVTGAVTPIACKPQLSDNGIVDFGNINTNILSKDDVTLLTPKEFTLSINCTAPAKIALLATNGRPGTTLAETDEGPAGTAKPLKSIGTAYSPGVAGLGMDGDKKIGAYSLETLRAEVDGKQGSTLRSGNKTEWATSYSTSYFGDNGHYKYISWRNDDSLTPTPFKTLTTNIRLYAYVNKTSELDLTKPIKLDGQTNFEMYYL